MCGRGSEEEGEADSLQSTANREQITDSRGDLAGCFVRAAAEEGKA